MRDNNELQMLKSTDILNVEVITNPGAGYDADTRAVVKITTNKKRSNGLMAQLDAEAAQSNHFSHNEGVSVSYLMNKLNIFGSYRFERTKEDIKYDVTQTSYEKELTYDEISSSKYTDKSNRHSYSAGMSYDFNERNSIGIQYTGYDSQLKTSSSPEEDWIRMYEDNNLFANNTNALSGKDNSQFHNISMYYQTQATEKLSIQIDADYAYNKLKSHELVTEMFNLTNTTETTNTFSHNSSKVYAAKGSFDYQFNRGIYYMKSFGYSELSVQKSFLSDRLHLTLRGEDLFNWSKTKDTKYLSYLVSNRATNQYGRRVTFSISWNFNNFKTKFKGTGAGEDEKNRL